MGQLIKEPVIVVSPSLAMKYGLNEALLIQQLHFRLNVATTMKDGYKWVKKSYIDWQQEFPFWSITTIRRTVKNLEKKGVILSQCIQKEHTKLYRLCYEEVCNMDIHPVQNEQRGLVNMDTLPVQNEQQGLANMDTHSKEVSKNNNHTLIIQYLNHKAHKQFRTNSKASIRLIQARLKEGYTVEHFYQVIDYKVSQWLHDRRMCHYVRPSTLFSAIHFENYVNECQALPQYATVEPFVLDMTKGEDL